MKVWSLTQACLLVLVFRFFPLLPELPVVLSLMFGEAWEIISSQSFIEMKSWKTITIGSWLSSSSLYGHSLKNGFE